MEICSLCPKPVRALGQRYCPQHHAEAQRKYREAQNTLLAEARKAVEEKKRFHVEPK